MTFHLQLDQTNKFNTSNLMLKIIEVIWSESLDYNPSVLPIDTIFNLCDLWVTDTSYGNKRLINRESGKNPIFLGPMMLHFTKDEGAFDRFAPELLAADPKLIELKNLGVDMESAIYQGFKNFIPSINHLLCGHFKQRE